MLSALLTLYIASRSASAEVISAVPPGVSIITVLVCERPQGCPAEERAMAAHLDSLGLPLLQFGTVANAGPGGGLARVRFDKAMALAARSPTLTNLEAARSALDDLPVTLPTDIVFGLLLQLGAAQLYAGDATSADRTFEAAVSSSDGRVVNLPALPPAVSDAGVARYLYLASEGRQDRPLAVISDGSAPGDVYVDGRRVGSTPFRGTVRTGWHRLSVERAGRSTAWVANVEGMQGGPGAPLQARLAGDDGEGFLSTAVEGALRGVTPPPEAGDQLASWARSQGLRWVRFVALVEPGATDMAGVPEEHVEDAEHHGWNVHGVWLDVGTERFGAGPGPASLRVGGSPDRLRVGVGVGYARLQPLDEDYGPHDHVGVDLGVRWRLKGDWSVDVRVGFLRSAQLYYLREGVFEHDVYPVAVGVRFGDRRKTAAGPYIGAQALVIVPLAEGAQVFLGYELAPTWRWRVGFEARAGMTTDGFIGGAGVTFATGG